MDEALSIAPDSGAVGCPDAVPEGDGNVLDIPGNSSAEPGGGIAEAPVSGGSPGAESMGGAATKAPDLSVLDP